MKEGMIHRFAPESMAGGGEKKFSDVTRSDVTRWLDADGQSSSSSIWALP